MAVVSSTSACQVGFVAGTVMAAALLCVTFTIGSASSLYATTTIPSAHLATTVRSTHLPMPRTWVPGTNDGPSVMEMSSAPMNSAGATSDGEQQTPSPSLPASLMVGVAAIAFAVPFLARRLMRTTPAKWLAPLDIETGDHSPLMAMASTSGVRGSGLYSLPQRPSLRLNARVGPHTYEPYYDINGTRFYTDEFCNTTTRILEKVGVNLHLVPNHPLNILKKKVEASFPGFEVFDNLTPVVTTFQNFDTLLIPEGHPARSPKDTYYLNKTTLMRPHTSAHQHDLLAAGNTQFLCIGDVYRRDEIDKTHFWCFHQCEGVKVMDTTDPKVVEQDLKASLENMVRGFFGDLNDEDIRWVDAYFPFTEPSFEMEIRWQGEWLEVLGCGIMQQEILRQAGADGNGTKMAWAFGIGLERIAMPLFKIPDIRIFWSTNKRFLGQFADGEIREFQPLVSTKDYPANLKDISMWVPEGFNDNDFFDLIQNFEFATLIEEVELFDEFTHPKTKRNSKAFHVVFRSPERTLTTEEVNAYMDQVRASAVEVLGVELR